MLRITKIWLKISSMAVQTQLTSFWAGLLFLIGKILRFLFFFVFLFSVLSKTQTIAGYTREQAILFFLVFNLIDTLTQALFRGVYRFRPLIVSGDYDMVLLQPIPSFFRPIFGWSDIFDFIILVPLTFYSVWFAFSNGLVGNIGNFLIFISLFANSLVLAFSLHLSVCAICILTTEIDHLVMFYRDLTNMGRFPTDIYQKEVRYFLTFVVPVVVLITVPAKSLVGTLSFPVILLSFVVGGVFLVFSWKFWKYSVARYSSASS